MEIGKWKVDGTLLARQRARWLGQDLFLSRHGGDEFADLKDKDRVEFGDGNDRYSVYVKLGDCLIWDGQKWQNVRLGESSINFPLMCVTKVDDRVMTLVLWDVGGQGHVVLNLIKSKEAWTPKLLKRISSLFPREHCRNMCLKSKKRELPCIPLIGCYW